MGDVDQTPLPGVGIRYDFATGGGRRVGLVVRRDDAVELLVYAEDDPDEVVDSVVLDPHDRATLGELLALPPGGDAGGRTHHRVWHLTEDSS